MGGPVIDVGSTTRCGADSALVDWIVDTVMVAGEFRKWHGKLLYPKLGQRKEELLASGQRILGELGLL